MTMKKFFFFAAALMISGAAMAEVYVPSQTDYPTEAEAKGGADKTAVEAGATLYTGTAFDVKNAFATTYQRVGLNANAYTAATVGSETAVAEWGIQGNDNPKDAEGGNPATTLKAPTQGAAFLIDVKQDGYIYVVNKMSSNKHYAVFELYQGEATALGYVAAMITCPAGKEALSGKTAWLAGLQAIDVIEDSIITYSPEVDADNYVTEAIVFPEIPMLKDLSAREGYDAEVKTSIEKNGAYAQNGLGVVAFPVEENTSYYVLAAGSKMSLASIVFTAEDNVPFVVSNGNDNITLFEGFTAATEGIENTTVLKATKAIENGKIVVLKNGVKFNVLGARL